jgi:hypothetical protein
MAKDISQRSCTIYPLIPPYNNNIHIPIIPSMRGMLIEKIGKSTYPAPALHKYQYLCNKSTVFHQADLQSSGTVPKHLNKHILPYQSVFHKVDT